MLAGGTVLYHAGNISFRKVLRTGPVMAHTVVAVLALASVPLGNISATAQLIALVILFIIAFIVEDVIVRKKEG